MSDENSSKFQNGAVNWTGFTGGDRKPNTKDLFLRLQPGSNVVRLLTVPYQYHQHKYRVSESDPNKYGRRINCAGAGCPICATGDRAKRRWLVGVIDQRTGMYKILDIGYSVFKGIQLLAQDSDWGDPADYSVDLSVHPEAGPQGFYGVVAKPKKPLTAAELSIKDAVDYSELERRTTPPTPEQVQIRLDKIMAEINGSSVVSDSSSLVSQSSNSSDISEDDDDDFFPSFDKAKTA